MKLEWVDSEKWHSSRYGNHALVFQPGNSEFWCFSIFRTGQKGDGFIDTQSAKDGALEAMGIKPKCAVVAELIRRCCAELKMLEGLK